MKILKKGSKNKSVNEDRIAKLVLICGVINIGIFFITLLINLLSDGKLHAISYANLVIGSALIIIHRTNKKSNDVF